MNNIYTYHEISVVVDNNILVDLYELERIDLLFDIFDVVIIPKEIYEDEVMIEIKDELAKYNYVLSHIDSEIGYGIFKSLSNDYNFRNLSTYDKFAISIAKQTNFYCNSNDGLVRRACKLYDIESVGILGVLGRAYKFGILSDDELRNLVCQIQGATTTCYIKSNIIREFLQSIFKN